ncbi:MAG TPA: hypothetical protein P5210_00730 [Draconibacterium sp.]|nr:hypothetical protein [Draconibacterium sp.]
MKKIISERQRIISERQRTISGPAFIRQISETIRPNPLFHYPTAKGDF